MVKNVQREHTIKHIGGSVMVCGCFSQDVKTLSELNKTCQWLRQTCDSAGDSPSSKTKTNNYDCLD